MNDSATTRENPEPGIVGAAVSDVLEYHFEVYPHAARDIGRHDFDGEFPDVFRPSMDDLDRFGHRLRSLESVADPELRADVRTSLAWLDRERFRVAVMGRPHRGPSECLGEADIWVYLKKPYDSVDEKVAALDAHLAGLPGFLERAGRTLETELPVGERLRSIEFARALAADLRDVVELVAIEHPESRAMQLAGPGEAAAAACEDFERAIEATAPIAAVLGPERLAEWVRVAEGIDSAPADLLEEAQDEVDSVVSALDSLAAKLGVGRRRGFYDLMERPASTETALDSLRRIIGDVEDFWIQRDVVSVETANPLEYRRRPRMFAAAQFGISGPFALGRPPHPHFLYLPERSDSVEDVESRQHFSLPMLEMVAVHETFAGHYVHAEAAFRQTRGIRTSLRLWAGFVEGWAHYVEELAIEQGLADDRPLVHAAQLLSALEAATRLLVYLSVNTGRWKFGEAVTEAAVLCDWSPGLAAREVLSATSDWRTGLYTLGKLRIREWRRAAVPGATTRELKSFHDSLIQCGFAPLGTVWQYYLDCQREAGVTMSND